MQLETVARAEVEQRDHLVDDARQPPEADVGGAVGVGVPVLHPTPGLLAVVGGYALQVHPDKLLRRDHIVIDRLLNRFDCRFDQIEADRFAAMFGVHANADHDEHRGSDQAAEAEHGTGSFHGPLLALHDSERITVG